MSGFDKRIADLKATYLVAYPFLTEADFTEAAENVGNWFAETDDWLDAFACHIADVADRRRG